MKDNQVIPPTETPPMGGKIGISFALDFKDADGNVLKTIHVNGKVPLSELNLTDESMNHGTDPEQ